MPTFPSERFAHIEEFLESCDDGDLLDYFRAHPNDSELDAWLLAHALTPRGQLMLRCARMAASSMQSESGLELLIGVPLSVTRAGARSLDTVRGELEAGLSYLLGATVVAAPAPHSCQALHNKGATQLNSWGKLMHLRLVGELEEPTQVLPEVGPYVWVLAVRATAAQAEETQALMYRMNPEITRLTQTLRMRLEGLLEEQGARVRVFPPTALWNSLSVARLTFARDYLERLSAPSDWQLVYHLGRLQASGPGGDFRLELPEELPSDVAPLLKWFQSRRG